MKPHPRLRRQLLEAVSALRGLRAALAELAGILPAALLARSTAILLVLEALLFALGGIWAVYYLWQVGAECAQAGH